MSDIIKSIRPWFANIITVASSLVLITWSVAMEHKEVAILSEKIISIESNIADMKVEQKLKDEQQDRSNAAFQERIYHQLDRVENKVDSIALRIPTMRRA